MEKIKNIIKFIEKEFEIIALVLFMGSIVLVGILSHCTTRPLDTADKLLLQRMDERWKERYGLPE